MDRLKPLHASFEQAFSRRPEGTARGPGRVNLIGEHTDYNDGFVLPIAIERETLGAFAVRDDRRVRIASLQQPGASVEIDLSRPVQPDQPAWANYVRGVIAGLKARKVPLVGADVLFDSTVPIGGGLSSSASLEVTAALAMLAACGQSGAVTDYELAKLCQAAEHEFAGAPCGIMDQAIVLLGRAGRAMLMDCRTGEIEHIPFDDPDKVLLVVDTCVEHELADGGYAARREQCFEAAE